MTSDLEGFARRYAKAWSSQNPEGVAAFFAEGGSLSVNDEPPPWVDLSQRFNSKGHFDAAEYGRQLEHGVEGTNAT